MNNNFWDTLTGYGTTINVKKNIVLGGKSGETTNFVYLLEEGICALTGFTKHGEEKVYLYFHAHRIICFNQLIVSPQRLALSGPEFFIITKTDCTLCRIPADTFHSLITSNTEFDSFLIETLADNYDEALVHFHLMQEESVTARLCRLLLEVSQTQHSTRAIPKFFTYEELAKYLGSHPVTVSRIMAKLKHCGYITRTSYGITLENEAALWELINNKSDFKY